ncbi:nuclear transport factor 2 family protein [Streptomyces diacarni]|uniref:nuclear transport factor 2 family protein n=1 Tax=Streptomyces diacarni TaxID=2800381 RepID=UPI0033FF0667
MSEQPTSSMAGTEWHDIVDFVERSTYRIWNEREVDLITRTYTPQTITHMDSGDMVGVEHVVEDTERALAGREGFRGRIDETIWTGNDRDGYRTSMRWTWTARNAGDPVFGGPTGRWIRVSATANCAVKGENYVEEWKAWDPGARAAQLGIGLDAAARMWGSTSMGKQQPEGRPAAEFGVRVPAIPARVHGSGELVQGHLTALFGKGDAERVFAAYSNDARLSVGTSRTYQHLAGIKNYVDGWLRLMPEREFRIDELYWLEDFNLDRVAVRWNLAGTVPTPRGEREVSVMGINHVHVHGDKIVAEFAEFDELSLHRQITGM